MTKKLIKNTKSGPQSVLCDDCGSLELPKKVDYYASRDGVLITVCAKCATKKKKL